MLVSNYLLARTSDYQIDGWAAYARGTCAANHEPLIARALFLRTDCSNVRRVTRYITPRYANQYPPHGV